MKEPKTTFMYKKLYRQVWHTYTVRLTAKERKNNMTATVYCRTTQKGIQSFYIKDETGTYYLFSQNYRSGVRDYYVNGVSLKNAIDCSKGGGNVSLLRTMTKIPKYVRYIEQEYGIAILNKTIRANAGRKCA